MTEKEARTVVLCIEKHRALWEVQNAARAAFSKSVEPVLAQIDRHEELRREYQKKALRDREFGIPIPKFAELDFSEGLPPAAMEANRRSISAESAIKEHEKALHELLGFRFS